MNSREKLSLKWKYSSSSIAKQLVSTTVIPELLLFLPLFSYYFRKKVKMVPNLVPFLWIDLIFINILYMKEWLKNDKVVLLPTMHCLQISIENNQFYFNKQKFCSYCCSSMLISSPNVSCALNASNNFKEK